MWLRHCSRIPRHRSIKGILKLLFHGKSYILLLWTSKGTTSAVSTEHKWKCSKRNLWCNDHPLSVTLDYIIGCCTWEFICRAEHTVLTSAGTSSYRERERERETSALGRVQQAELPPLNSIMLSHLASTTGPVCCGRGSVWTQRANQVKAQHLDKCHKFVGKFNHAFLSFFFFFLGDLFVTICFCWDCFCSGQYKLHYICLRSQKDTL